MTLREAFNRCRPNEKGERVVIGKSDAGEEFMAVEMEGGGISFWGMRGIGHTEKMLFQMPEDVVWEPK